jgi:HAD superfamily phosphoserine phosphatase-like hydrolase
MTHIIISLDEQSLELFENETLVASYKISSGLKGMGFEEGSLRTPTGRFAISSKIGADAALYTRFQARVPIGIWDVGYPSDADMILTRILQLNGLDSENANTLSRYIYIHGTNREDLLGQPASHGCIRMANADIIELFEKVQTGTEVNIKPITIPKAKLLFIDCDSTLSSIEGIDELARLADPQTFVEVEALTNAAMNGEVPLNEVFRRRMEIIRPNKKNADLVGEEYVKTIVPGVVEMLSFAKQHGWLPIILSGGFAPLIQPLADHLGIKHLEAVPLFFDSEGSYAGYGEDYPTTRNLGKNEIIRHWKNATLPAKVIMIGDGISDLETQTDVDLMIGFGGVIARDKVKAGAQRWITSFDPISSLYDIFSS